MLRATPPGEDSVTTGAQRPRVDARQGTSAAEREKDGVDWLQLVALAEQQANLYVQQVNRRFWSRSYRAFHNQHFEGSKYGHRDWAHRSKIFRPKTRSAVRKDMAAVAASLFGTVDAITCSPGNEGDARQRAAAELMQELVNYRTDRTSGRNAIPWMLTAIGARQDAEITGICVSKQYWKLNLRKSHDEPVTHTDEDGIERPLLDVHPETGETRPATRPVLVPDIDRPDVMLFPPECVLIDPAADWTNPAQSAAYLVLKYPMRLDDVRRNEQDPRNPWHRLSPDVLKGAAETMKFDAAAIRRAREFGLDRFDETMNAAEFDVVWVYENFFRVNGEDMTFFSVGNQHYLTDPQPTREVYPEQDGDRPVVFGYGSLESHRIFPMSPVESWQQTQAEINDVANLFLDTLKLGIAPITKVRRGRNIDLDAVHRRGPNSHVLVQAADDVTFEPAPSPPPTVQLAIEKLDVDMDDLAGQFNSGTVQTNRSLNDTVGGLQLVAGAASTVQEFDIRLWLETWCEPVLAQIVRLEQYYESNEIILGLAGERAQLIQKHGISQITDDLLAHQVTVRVNAGLGNGDPRQRLQKFQMAIAVAAPLLAQSREFQAGELGINVEEIMNEVFGAVGYRDGGKRFIKQLPPPPPNPQQNLLVAKLQAEIEKAQNQGKGALLSGLAAVRRVDLGNRTLEAAQTDALLDRAAAITDARLDHHHRTLDRDLAALDMGHRHAHALAERMRSHPSPERGGSAAGGGRGGVSPAATAGPVFADAPPPPPAAPALRAAAIADASRRRDLSRRPEAAWCSPLQGEVGVPASPPGGDDQAALLAHLAQILAAPRRRIVKHHRGPDGRVSHSEVIDQLDPGTMA
jgi:hypothetical protein